LTDEERRRVEENKRKRWEAMNVSVKSNQTILGKPSASELTDLRIRTEKRRMF
jgi:hypothetical protein